MELPRESGFQPRFPRPLRQAVDDFWRRAGCVRTTRADLPAAQSAGGVRRRIHTKGRALLVKAPGGLVFRDRVASFFR